jgi:hypothetical protein
MVMRAVATQPADPLSIETLPRLTALGRELERSPDKLGYMRESNDILHDPEAMRARQQRDGYLLFRGLLNRPEVLEARRACTERLMAGGMLEPGTDPMDGIIKKDSHMSFMPGLADNNVELKKVIYHGPMMRFFDRFLGVPALHYDFTWIRVVSPGNGTPPHCDIVYMGRGSHNLHTAWTPIGDIDMNMGGLMVLEGSNNIQRMRDTYCTKDVDTYCTNREHATLKDWSSRKFGWLSYNPVQIRKTLGGRWLTHNFRAGDVVIFSVFTVHGGLDNHTGNLIRLSSDTRYQPANEPADERWVGEKPLGHGGKSRKGLIC